jgi:hypothetical protein
MHLISIGFSEVMQLLDICAAMVAYILILKLIIKYTLSDWAKILIGFRVLVSGFTPTPNFIKIWR